MYYRVSFLLALLVFLTSTRRHNPVSAQPADSRSELLLIGPFKAGELFEKWRGADDFLNAINGSKEELSESLNNCKVLLIDKRKTTAKRQSFESRDLPRIVL